MKEQDINKLNTLAGLVTTLSHYIDGEYGNRDQELLGTIRNSMVLMAEGKLDKAILMLRKLVHSINL